jgi:cold shock protein
VSRRPPDGTACAAAAPGVTGSDPRTRRTFARALTQQRDATATKGISGRSTLRCASVKDLDIRRPDLKGTRRHGTVRWFNDDKGYGRITADDGEVLFVHFSGIVSDGFRTLDQGDRVSFTWNGGIADHGRHVAENVRRET